MWPMATADGSKVYFVSDRTGPQNIWSMPRGGQAKQVTTFTDGRVLWPNLSYDGQEVVFERNFKLWKMKTDGGKPQELSITLHRRRIEPDQRADQSVDANPRTRPVARRQKGRCYSSRRALCGFGKRRR